LVLHGVFRLQQVITKTRFYTRKNTHKKLIHVANQGLKYSLNAIFNPNGGEGSGYLIGFLDMIM
jgi:hypothetical protein